MRHRNPVTVTRRRRAGGHNVRMVHGTRVGILGCALVALVITSCAGSSESAGSTASAPDSVPVETSGPALEPTGSSATVRDSVPVETTTPEIETTLAPMPTTTTTIASQPIATTTSIAPTIGTSPATPPATAPDTPAPAPAPPGDGPPSLDGLTLSGSGIGAAQFGADPDGIITFMSSYLGAPTADTGYVDPFTIGPCGGTELRLVSWGSLTLTFGDVSTVAQGRRHFFSYSYGIEGQPDITPAGLATETGITVGSPLSDVVSGLPNAVINPADEFTPPNFYLSDDFRGYLTGLADDSTVSVIFGGIGCGL